MKLKNALFFGKRLLTDFNENKHLATCTDNRNTELTYYYFLFKEDKINTRGGNHPFQFDEAGIPLVHSYIDVVDGKGYYYYPITIGQTIRKRKPTSSGSPTGSCNNGKNPPNWVATG